MELNEHLRITHKDEAEGSESSIHINGRLYLYSHTGRLGVIWNNLIGCNFSKTLDYRNYLVYAQSQGLEEGKLEFKVKNVTIREYDLVFFNKL